MAHSIIKSKVFVPMVVGQPYRPAMPARDVWETRTVCGYRYTGSGSGHYEYVTSGSSEAGGGGTTAIWVPDPGHVGGPSSYTYACWDETVLVHYPAQTEQPGIASSPPHFDYQLGWNSGARSVMFITDDAYATFQARASMVGAICGLNGHEDPQVYNGTSIKFAFYLARGLAKVIEQGAIKSASFAYTDASVFKIDRDGGQITYLIDDVLVYTSAVDDSTEPLWLQVSLYAGDDEVFNPELTQVSALDDETEITGTLTLTLPPPVATLREGDGGILRLTLPGPDVELTQGLAAPAYALLTLVLPPLVPNMYGLIGAVGQLNLSLPPPSIIAADRDFGRLRLTLPPPDLFARSYPLDVLPGGDGQLILGGALAAYGVVRLPTALFVGILSGDIGAYAEITLDTVTMTGILGGDMAAQGVVTLPAAGMVGILGGSISVLTGLNELWAMNITGGQPGGTTQYDRYEFNSFAKIGGRYYGAREDGLFLLEGEDDAGEHIDASFGFGKLDFGTPQQKTVSYCYLGAAAGALDVTIEALLRDEPESFTYEARGHGPTMREVRFALGKGLKSTYVQPTFSNVDGDAFEVDTIEFAVNDLIRKV